MKVVRNLTVFVLTLVSCCMTAWCAKTNAPDTFAEIASGSEKVEKDDLVTPQPPKLPHKIIRYGRNDPSAIFQPADKMDTAEELTNALVAMRKQFAPFFENHAPTQTPTREIQSLKNFDWRIATPEDWQNFPAVIAGAGQWTKVTIPHFGEPLGKTNTFYRTTFSLDAWNTNEAIFVRFRGVDYKAHVFINGAFVGSHEGFFAPFEFDVTRYVHPGENALFVQVDNDFPTLGVVNDPNYPDLMGDKIYGATGPGFDDPEAGWHHDPPGMGIYQPVTVEIRPRVHVHDIFVRPLPDKKSAEALIEIWNCDATTNDIQIHFAVDGLNFAQHVVATNIAHPDFACSGVSFYRVKVPLKKFRWWSPDAPWLYDFQVSVTCSNLNTIDHAHRHFGMRSFRMEESKNPKGRFFLNGEEICLRGANTMGFEQQDVMRGETNQLHDDLLLAKIAHMNFLRTTQRSVPEEVYDLADQLGLMIQTDFPLFAHMRPNQFAEGLRQVGEMERLIRAHPSCILVTYINERFGDRKSRGKIAWRMNRAEQEEFFRAADEVVHQANPDRVIKAVDGDYDPPAPGLPDNHCYTLWYLRNGLDIGLLHEGFWQPVKPGWDYGCGEFGAEGLDRLELMRKYCPTNWLPQTPADTLTWSPTNIAKAQTGNMYSSFFDKPDSIEGWINASREYQAFATRMMTEAFRRDNCMVSFAIHLFIDAWPTGWMKAIVDVERQPKPAYFAYREALTPLTPNIRTDRWKFFSGEKMKCEFWVLNDTHAVPTNAILKWELEVGGKIVHARQLSAKVKPVESVFQGFTAIPVPDVAERTKATLRLALFDGDRQFHDTSIDVEFFPKPKPIDVAVQIIGSKTNVATRLARQLKLHVVKSGAGFQPAIAGKMPAPLILIDDYAKYEKRRSEIDSAVTNGATVIFLNLPKGDYVLPGWVSTTTISTNTEPCSTNDLCLGTFMDGSVTNYLSCSTNYDTVKSANPPFVSRKTGHPLVVGFQQWDFHYWFDEKAGMLTPLVSGKITSPSDQWTPILLAQEDIAVGERKVGKGCVIFCELFLADRVKTNPTARMFAERVFSR